MCLWLAAIAPASAVDLTRAEVQELEQLLVRLGFNPGLVDGIADARTTAAIENYQEFAALRVDGAASPALLEELRGVAESLGVAVKSTPTVATSPGDSPEQGDAGPGASEIVETTDSEMPPPTGEVTGAPWDTAVHLASFKQEAKAHTEWQRLQQHLPNLFGDMEARVGAFDLGDEGLFFRLFAGPFPNLATAQDFCIVVSLEGFRCAIARGAALQIAATSPATPEPTSAPESPEAQSDAESEAPTESAAAAEAETAAASEAPPGDTAMAADPAATAPSEAPEAPPGLEDSPAAEQPDAAETPEIQEVPEIREEVAVTPGPDDDIEASPSAPALAEPTEETGSSTAPAAPTTLVAAEQMAAQTAETAPEAGSETVTGDATDDATEDPINGAKEDPAEALVETGQPETAAAGPTLLIAATQFAEAPADVNLGDEGEERPRGSAIGSPTLLATMFDFGDEEEAPSAPPEPVSGGAPSVAASETGEPATGEAPKPEHGESRTADVGGEVGEAAATAPAEAPEPEGTQTAAVPESGVEDYMKATAAFQIGDCTTALRHYDQAFDTGGLPREALASAHNNRGRCHYSLGRFDRALADFDRAIGLDKDFAAAYYNRGRVHTAMGHSAQARSDLKSAYELGFGRLQAQE